VTEERRLKQELWLTQPTTLSDTEVSDKPIYEGWGRSAETCFKNVSASSGLAKASWAP
jgi:hypothetical protein